MTAKQRITRIYIYVMLIAFPLFTGFHGYTEITSSKLAFYLTATAVWLFSLLAVSLVKAQAFSKRRLSPAQICILIYFALCCASAALSPYGSAVLLGAGRFDGLLEIALSVCIFMGVSRYAKPERGYIYALAISMTLCCAVAVLQLYGKNPLGLFPSGWTYYDMGTQYSGEFLGTIGNANLFSAFLALCLPILIAFFIVGSRHRYFYDNLRSGHKNLCMSGSSAKREPLALKLKKFEFIQTLLPVIALGMFCLFKCTVSAGKLALIVCVLFAVPVLALRNMKRNRRRFICLYTALAILGVGIALYYIAHAYPGTEGTLYELSRVLRGDIQDSFGSSRIQIWRKCLELIRERPILGGGPGTSALRLDISFSRFVEETGKTLSSTVDNTHNVYLGILTDTGVLSLLAYLTAMVLTLINAIKTGAKRPLVLALACGLFCYWIQDFFGLGLFLVSPLMWIVFGLTAPTHPAGFRCEAEEASYLSR